MDANGVGYAPLLFPCCWHKSRLKSPIPVVQSPQDQINDIPPSLMNEFCTKWTQEFEGKKGHILLLCMHLVYSICKSVTPRIWATLTKATQQSLVIHTKIAQHFKECTV